MDGSCNPSPNASRDDAVIMRLLKLRAIENVSDAYWNGAVCTVHVCLSRH